MDTVAQPLSDIILHMEKNGIRYRVTITEPTKKTFPLEETLYVVKQQLDADGTYNVIAAAKMGKEVC